MQGGNVLEYSIYSIQLKALCVFLGCWHDVIQSELGFHGTFHVSFCLVPPWCLSFLAGAWDPLPPYVSCSTGHCPLCLFCLKSLVIPSQIIIISHQVSSSTMIVIVMVGDILRGHRPHITNGEEINRRRTNGLRTTDRGGHFNNFGVGSEFWVFVSVENEWKMFLCTLSLAARCSWRLGWVVERWLSCFQNIFFSAGNTYDISWGTPSLPIPRYILLLESL